MLGSLSDVVFQLTVEEFLRAFRDRRRLHIAATDPRRAHPLLSWQDVETMISLRGFDAVEAMQNGMLIPPQLYRSGPDLGAFHDMLAQGASFIINQIQLHLPRIQGLTTSMERELGFTVGVNAYFSFASGGAFKPHWDRHDVLVVQVHGAKTWKIWDSTFKNPVERSRHARHDITDAPAQELELSPGDVLYIPRGEPHAASVSGGSSVHLTFGLNSLNGVDVLQQLQEAAGQDDFLRGDLPPRAAVGQLRDHQAELKARLHRLVDGLDLAALLEKADANRPPVLQPSLAWSDAPDDVLRLTLRRRISLPEAAADGEPPPPVTIGGAAYSLSPAAIAILRRLFASDGDSRGDLMEALAAHHDGAAVTAGLRELSRLGFLELVRA